MFHTQMFHTQMFHTQLAHTHNLSHNLLQLCHTHTHAIFHTQLCHKQFCHTQLFHTQLCHRQCFTHKCFTHNLSHTTLYNFSRTTLSHTTLHIQLLKWSILDHFLCVFFFLRAASTTFSDYWKKLTCGVIRSFNFHLCFLCVFASRPKNCAGQQALPLGDDPYRDPRDPYRDPYRPPGAAMQFGSFWHFVQS